VQACDLGWRRPRRSIVSIVDPVEKRLAHPFYLKMMGLNAVTNADALWEDLVAAGRGATEDEVKRLLSPDHWRPVVMGSWFSLKFGRDQVGDSLMDAVGLCRGTLTAPSLTVAAATVIGRTPCRPWSATSSGTKNASTGRHHLLQPSWSTWEPTPQSRPRIVIELHSRGCLKWLIGFARPGRLRRPHIGAVTLAVWRRKDAAAESGLAARNGLVVNCPCGSSARPRGMGGVPGGFLGARGDMASR